jgi:8-oxo-dGTP pyrophosphatase MutT (NUDIX family)
MAIPEIKDKELHRITTTTLIYKFENGENKYLITRRAMHKKAHPGMWTIPGGGLTVDDYVHSPMSEYGENLWYGVLEKSLRREIKEEVNLEIGKPELLIDLAFIRPDAVPVICFSCYTPYISGEVKIDQDTDGDTIDFAWVNLEEAKSYDLIPGIWDEIRQVDEILNSRNS